MRSRPPPRTARPDRPSIYSDRRTILTSSSLKASDVRAGLGHPVVDADGHYIETMPILKPYLVDSIRELAGAEDSEAVA